MFPRRSGRAAEQGVRVTRAGSIPGSVAVGWIRWWLVRLWVRTGGMAEVERILQADACSECGSWRCLQCHQLIMLAADHAPTCRLYQPWH